MSTALQDILVNHVKAKFARNEVVASMTVRLVRGVEIARIAKTAGFDTLYVDMEHCSFSIDTTGQICMAALEAGITPLVRVPANTPEYISRVLDAGAMGVIAPHVRSADEARAVVRAAKFPPLGDRSANAGLPHLQYRSFPASEANPALNEAVDSVIPVHPCAGMTGHKGSHRVPRPRSPARLHLPAAGLRRALPCVRPRRRLSL